jgi:hypothetical protein
MSSLKNTRNALLNDETTGVTVGNQGDYFEGDKMD